MAPIIDRAQAFGHIALEAAAETIWPTRCAVCDVPGEVLCAECRLSLPYIDWWRACPRCGAPFGRVQCSECNATMMARIGRTAPPFASCASVVAYGDAAARIVRTYKDHGERRLVKDIAQALAWSVHPTWIAEAPCLVTIPATTRALRQRGFDHMDEVGHQLSELLELPLAHPLARPRSADQRKLSRLDRLSNMQGRFSVLAGASVPERILLVDDVITTGATLYDATDALLGAGAKLVRCLTFARVW